MNEEYKELARKLSTLLCEQTWDWMGKTFGKEGGEILDLINLTLGSHLNSAFTLMKTISEENPEIMEEIDEFIDYVLAFFLPNNSNKNIKFH